MRALPFSARRALLWGLMALLSACTDSYLPDVLQNPEGFLVVDGFINPQGITIFKLTRTYAIGAKTAPPAEAKATVYVEEESGPRYALRESPAGTYASAGALALNPTKRYRLHLNTAGGQEFASDYVAVKITPPLDQVKWQITPDGLGVYLSTHDDTKRTQYYRLETDETWEITPVYSPAIEYNFGIRNIAVPFPRLCYGNAHSTVVQLEKTTSYTEDALVDYRVRLLPSNSERLFTRYSLLVQQHALTKEEYGYWEQLRKNTENLGTLFDPQPSQLTGNVRCLTNPNTPALGYVGAHSLAEKRIFIARTDLPRSQRVLSGYESCIPPDTVYLDRPNPPGPPAVILQSAFAAQQFLPIDPVRNAQNVLIGYTGKDRNCIDCRTRGTVVKPSFWP